MCGIAGFIDFNKLSSKSDLQRMTDALQHRGPDDSGYEFFSKPNSVVGLGHRRLSIIDLSSKGHQPFFSYDQRYCIVYNGEIYNFNSIKNILEDKGYTFSSTSDTEVLLYSFIEWGVAAVHHFIGMFAFVIYDSHENILYLFRDRAGVKPLYFYDKDGIFLFASELKSFHSNPYFEKSIDTAALNLYLMYGYIPAPYTIFSNARKLLPGHFLTIQIDANKKEVHKYWDVNEYYSKPKLQLDEKQAITATEEILSSAFNYRMVSDVPVGVFLSSGIDSTLVAAILQKKHAHKIKTFTIGFKEKKYNEADLARRIASVLGTDHTEILCSHEDSQNIVTKLPEFYDEPFADSSAIPTMLLSSFVAGEVSVALSADAGDEVFGGYNKYHHAEHRFHQVSRLPGIIKKLLSKNTEKYIPGRFYKQRKTHRLLSLLHKLSNYTLAENPADVMRLMSRSSSEAEIRKVIIQEYQNYKTYFEEYNLNSGIQNEYDRMFAIDYKTYLPDDIMVKVDRATMSAGLEGREPLLDHRIVEYVAQLPLEIKLKNGIQKYILKEIVYKYVPKEIMNHPKKGFSVPLVHWFNKELKHIIDKYTEKDLIRREKIFDPGVVLSIRDGYLSGNYYLWPLLWKIIVFEMWYERWMKQEGMF